MPSPLFLALRSGVAAAVLALGGCHDEASDQAVATLDSCEPVAFVAGERADDRYDLFRVDLSGRLDAVTDDLSTFDPAVAPDGSWLAAAQGARWSEGGYSDSEIVLMRPDGSVESRIPGRSGSVDHSPAIAPSGDRLAFIREATSGTENQVIVADRDGVMVRELATGPYTMGPAWRPDGSAVAVLESGPHPLEQHLVVIDLEGGVELRLPVEVDGDPVFSPDGKRVLFSTRSYESSAPTIEVDLNSGTQTTIRHPPGANWTNVTYADRGGEALRALRFEQSVELSPQRLEVIDRQGGLRSSTVLDIIPLAEGGGRTLLTALSTSSCFEPD